MTTETIDSESATPAPEAEKAKRKPSRKATPQKKAAKAKHAKRKANASNKKADVIALMKRAKGATLAEIMAATKWQPHTVRGFVSILGSKGGENIESFKSADGERTYKIK